MEVAGTFVWPAPPLNSGIVQEKGKSMLHLRPQTGKVVAVMQKEFRVTATCCCMEA